MMRTDKLVSTRVLRDRMTDLEQRVEGERRLRADDDPFFKHTAWMIAEFDAALREAEREYVSTADASRLTGWSAQTLRRWGKAVIEGEGVPDAWAGLLVRMDAGDMGFCVSSIPVKGQAAA